MPRRKHPANTLAEFTIQYSQRIDLISTDSWEVGLCEFSCPPVDVIVTTNALVYCDLITLQFVCCQYDRCLRTFIHESKYCDNSCKHIYYMPVEKHTFQDITILIADLNGKKIPFKSGEVPTNVVFHFRRV
jgi:hypothetical protein